MYECTICLSLNHNSRHTCQQCGAVPAKYSILGVPSRLIEHEGRMQFIPVVAALGCERANQHKGQRINLKTVALDYYGE